MDTIIGVKPKIVIHYHHSYSSSHASPLYRKYSSSTVKLPYKNRKMSPLKCSTKNSNSNSNNPEKKNISIFGMPESDVDNLFKAVAAILSQPLKMYFESFYYSFKFFKSKFKKKVDTKLKLPTTTMFLPRLLLMLYLKKTVAIQCATVTEFFDLPPSESVKKYKITVSVEEIH